MNAIRCRHGMAVVKFIFMLNWFWLSIPPEPAAQSVQTLHSANLFTDIAAPLVGVYHSSAAWGDYDNDGDLDILVTGQTAANSVVAKIYKNENGSFVDINAGLEGVDSGAAAWGDFDNDGDLDILLTGATGPQATGNVIAKIYENQQGSFIDRNASLTGVYASAAAWGDYDNDGDLDILLAGQTADGNMLTKIYQNNHQDFVDSKISLPGIANGSVAWGDYDNDGDLDILLAGGRELSSLAQIYRNDGGSFALADSLSGVYLSAAAWGDYDNDGDLDIFLAGETNEARLISTIYRNDSTGFVAADSLEGIVSKTVAWGDFDNDGDLDLLLTGNTRANTLAKVYRNEGGSFVEVDSLESANQSAASWGDYDNDGDLDILLAGHSRQGPITKVFRNNHDKANTLPTTPADLFAYATNDSAIFVWSPAHDVETPQASLTYNLRVGTTRGGGEIVSPMADEISGHRRLAQLGNINHNNFWIIAALRNGKYYWSVQAIDQAFAGSAFAPEDSFTIGDLEAPKISNVNFPATVDLTTPVGVSANVTDNSGFVQEVWLLYREGGRAGYDSTAMTVSANQTTVYQADISPAITGIRGVEFNIVAVDASANRKAFGWRPVQVKLPDRHLRKNHFGGSAQEAYRLISIPQISDDPSVDSILLPDLGAPDTTEWRLWAINPQRATSLFPYIEYPAVGNLAAGKAKFLITRENKILTSGAGATVKTTEPFAIALQEGWNMIASPFNFSIPIQNVQPKDLQANLYAYGGSWTAAPDSLRPWEGYMIKVSASTTLVIHPSEGIANPQSAIMKSAIAPDWQIRIAARCERASDLDNLIGVAKDAAMEWDNYERFEPPPIGEFVMLAFPHRDWQRNADVYTTDFHPSSADGQIFDFTVDTNISGKPVTLRFENFISIPGEFEVRLVDVSLKLTQDLRREPKYIYRSTRDGGKNFFRLLVGKPSFIAERAEDVTAIPTTYELAQNFPNPFNPSTTIKLGLPRKSRVTLKIYNLLGKEVAMLFDGVEKEAGYHAIIWEGKDQTGNFVPSGLYLYRLQAGQKVLIKKMTLIK